MKTAAVSVAKFPGVFISLGFLLPFIMEGNAKYLSEASKNKFFFFFFCFSSCGFKEKGLELIPCVSNWVNCLLVKLFPKIFFFN